MNRRFFLLAFALLVGRNLTAQEGRTTFWWVPTTLGYGALGVEVGYTVAWLSYQQHWFDNAPQSLRYPAHTMQQVAWGAGALGAVTGFVVGRKVDRAISNGKPLTGGQRRSVQAPTIVAGAAVGMYASYKILTSLPYRYFEDPGHWIPTALITAGGPAAGAYLGALVLRAADHTLRDDMRVGIFPTTRGATIHFALSIR